MKKLIAMVLLLTLLFTLAACGKETTPDPTDAPATDAPEASTTEEPVNAIPDALTLLETVWAKYAEDEKFAAAGGDYSEENAVSDAPGKCGLSDTALLDSVLGLPESAAAMIDDAASLMHMLNSNSFTCGAFRVANADDVSAVVDALKENILNRRWICGFPDKLVIFTVGNYVVSAFGVTDIMALFGEKLAEAYPDVVVACEEAIA